MKFLPPFLFAVAMALAPTLFAAGESVQQILEDGQRAMLRGDYAAAKRSFQIVAQVEPKNIIAATNLRIIQTKEAQMPKGNDTERQLSTVIMPRVEFKEATLGSVFDYLRQQVPKVSAGKQNVNFVLQLSEQQLSAPVTLQLSGVPVTVVLQYLGDVANLQMEYQKYAVKVTTRGAAAAPVTTAGPLPPGSDTPTTPATPLAPGLR